MPACGRPQHRKKDHPRPSLSETTRVNEGKTPQHDGTPRSCPRASISSASSRTSMEMPRVSRALALMSCNVLPGVPTTMWPRMGSCRAPRPRPRPPRPLPPEFPSDNAKATTRPFSSTNVFPINLTTAAFCVASSRVGQTHKPWTCGFDKSTFCSIPSAKAAVLPLPLLAWANRFSRTGVFLKPSSINGLRGAFPSSRSEWPQNKKRNHPRHREMDTSRVDGVKAPQHFKTRRSHG